MVATIEQALPFHVAHKKVAFLDAAGGRVQPRVPNAIKFERFIFDLMPAAETPLWWKSMPRGPLPP